MIRCITCRYFSDTVAKWEALSVQALCLNKDSPHFQKYQPDNGTCSQHEKGVPIDVREER